MGENEDLVKRKLGEYLSKNSRVVYEVESRIRDVTKAQFYNIIDFLKNNPQITKNSPIKKTSSIVILYDKNIRKIFNLSDNKEEENDEETLDILSYPDSKIINTIYEKDDIFKKFINNKKVNSQNIEKKETHEKYKLHDGKVVYSIASEIKLPNSYSKNLDSNDINIIRCRTRISFIIEKLLVDLTRVYEIDLSDFSEKEEGEERFEIEIEKGNASINNLFGLTNFLLSKVKDTKEHIIINMINKVLSGNEKETKSNSIDYSLISKPRNLKLNDLVFGGLVSEDISYYISPKADGINKLLVFYNRNAYLVQIPKKIEVLTTDSNIISFNDSIFIGEHIIEKQYDTGHGEEEISVSGTKFLPYDCVLINNKNIKDLDYNERYGRVLDLLEAFKYKDKGIISLPIKIIEKPIFWLGTNSESFYKVMNEVFENDNYGYEIDGYIFTPKESPYLTSGAYEAKNDKDRILSNYPDVCKYKPLHRLSIDFLVKKDGLYSKNQGNYILFQGKSHFKFDVNVNVRFNEENENFAKYLDKKGKSNIYEFLEKEQFNIIEFEFFKEDEDTTIITPTRYRQDKPEPNNINIAIENWILISDPIEESTLLGKDVRLMRLYHNKIKKELLEDLNEGDVIVDIGGGKGGDIQKWIYSDVSSVLSFEPNEEFKKEFEKRLLNTNTRGKDIKVVKAYGQDKDIIIKNAKEFFNWKTMKRMFVTFMISLSFFFEKDKEEYKKLAKTIIELRKLYYSKCKKPDCFQIIFFTIEGEKVIKLFQEKKKSEISLNTISLHIEDLSNPDKVYVDIKDSETVHEQVEYLVNLNLLVEEINKGIKKDNSSFLYADFSEANKEKFMSNSEKIYSNLFVYGRLSDDIQELVRYSIKKKNKENDDKLIRLYNNFYRMCTIDNNSYIHSILKLTSKVYRKNNYQERVDLSEEYFLSKKESKNLVVKHNIYIYDVNDMSFEKKNTDNYLTNIILIKIQNSYEPIIMKEGDDIIYIFDDKIFDDLFLPFIQNFERN